jgi:cbb3-type cytochrome c oxidase subunit III
MNKGNVGIVIFCLIAAFVSGLVPMLYLLRTPTIPMAVTEKTPEPRPELELLNQSLGKKLFLASACVACHHESLKLVGPPLQEVALKYKDQKAGEALVKKVIHGGKGNWGEIPMPPHSHLDKKDITKMVAYILDLASGDEVKIVKAETDDESLGRTPYTDQDAATRGQALFAQKCAACHMYDGRGKAGLAPSIRNRDFLALSSDDFIKQTIKQGREGTAMIAQNLSDSELKDLLAYLRAFKPKNPIEVFVDDAKVIHGDIEKGILSFKTYCASCHGEKGEGYIGGGAGPGIGLKGFLNVASDDYIFQTIKNGRIGTAMNSFMGPQGLANLSETEVNDIVAYLRSLNQGKGQ